MKNPNQIFKRFWETYTHQNPMALRISELFKAEGEEVVHDHIALRSFNIKGMDIESVSREFISAGYKVADAYIFDEKHLEARHFVHKTIADAPKVFISELQVEKCSPLIQETVQRITEQVDAKQLEDSGFIYRGRLWDMPSFSVYEQLRNESEYAAWLYVHGYRANHFAIRINALSKYNDIRKVNNFVKSHGYLMNIVNGQETYGSAGELLEQSSTKAEIIVEDFTEGRFSIPACFYEFTQRYPGKDGRLYEGFIAANADKIFQSTDYYVLKK